MAVSEFIARHDGIEKKLSVERDGRGGYRVILDGVEHVVDAKRFAAGTWSVLIDDVSFGVELEFSGDNESNGSYNALVRDDVVSLTILDERHARMGITSSEFSVDGPQTLTAPMPGKIVKILVAPGDVVEDDQPLLIMEAMKMENELKAPKAGTISALFVKEGAAVEVGEKLLAVE